MSSGRSAEAGTASTAVADAATGIDAGSSRLGFFVSICRTSPFVGFATPPPAACSALAFLAFFVPPLFPSASATTAELAAPGRRAFLPRSAPALPLLPFLPDLAAFASAFLAAFACLLRCDFAAFFAAFAAALAAFFAAFFAAFAAAFALPLPAGATRAVAGAQSARVTTAALDGPVRSMAVGRGRLPWDRPDPTEAPAWAIGAAGRPGGRAERSRVADGLRGLDPTGDLLGDLLDELLHDLVDELLLDDQSSVPDRSSHICIATVGDPTRCDTPFTQRLARRPQDAGSVPAPLP